MNALAWDPLGAYLAVQTEQLVEIEGPEKKVVEGDKMPEEEAEEAPSIIRKKSDAGFWFEDYDDENMEEGEGVDNCISSGQIQIWDTEEWSLKSSIDFDQSQDLLQSVRLSWSPDGKILAVPKGSRPHAATQESEPIIQFVHRENLQRFSTDSIAWGEAIGCVAFFPKILPTISIILQLVDRWAP